jgi:uncharacterized protein (DUF1501 family)
MSLTRRTFIKNGAIVVVGTAAVPSFLTRAAFGVANSTSTKRLVVIFQRGAADGLNIVIPHAEPSYFAMRPSIAIPRNQVIDLNGFFGLHPAMTSFKPLWDQGHLAIVHAAGSPDTTRSHFDAQDYMESGTPGVKSTSDGWLNRTLQGTPTSPKAGLAGDPASSASPFRGVALGTSLPRIQSGKASAVAVSNVNGFSIANGNPAAVPLGNTFEAMYAQSVDSVLHGTGNETFEAVKMLKSADPQRYTPAAGANYPKGRFGDALRQTAQLIKANLGVQIAFTDIGGWDHHVNEGSTEGQLANVLRDFSQSIAAFWTDLGPLGEETVIATMSEFGRTARENGNRGTDHGHANVMFLLGGPVKGGRVYGQWPGLDPAQLNEGRDLALTTDFRRVLGEAVSKHLGNAQLGTVFPGFANSPREFVGYVG